MNTSRLYQIVETGNVDREDIVDLRNLTDQYPYFQAAIFSYLDSLFRYDNSVFKTELSRLSIFVNDRKALFYYIWRDEYAMFFKRTGKEKLQEDKTNILLNAFFESHGTADSNTFEYDILNTSLASTDYFSYLKSTSEEVKGEGDGTACFKHQGIIDSYIEKSEKEGGIKIAFEKEDEQLPDTRLSSSLIEKEEELTDEMFFTETLAKIYVKQKKYEKAYKIIKHLSLNYPKKNVYFADQLSFLEKLIINSKYKEKK